PAARATSGPTVPSSRTSKRERRTWPGARAIVSAPPDPHGADDVMHVDANRAYWDRHARNYDRSMKLLGRPVRLARRRHGAEGREGLASALAAAGWPVPRASTIPPTTATTRAAIEPARPGFAHMTKTVATSTETRSTKAVQSAGRCVASALPSEAMSAFTCLPVNPPPKKPRSAMDTSP